MCVCVSVSVCVCVCVCGSLDNGDFGNVVWKISCCGDGAGKRGGRMEALNLNATDARLCDR